MADDIENRHVFIKLDSNTAKCIDDLQIYFGLIYLVVVVIPLERLSSIVTLSRLSPLPNVTFWALQ